MDQFTVGLISGVVLMAVKEVPSIALNRPFIIRRILLSTLQGFFGIGMLLIVIGAGSLLHRAAGNCSQVPTCFESHPSAAWWILGSGITLIALPIALLFLTRFFENARRDEDNYRRREDAKRVPKVKPYEPMRRRSRW